MNGPARGLRLASPVRVALASQLGNDLDGAWWPHTASVARELPGLIDALARRLGRIIDIGVNWSALAGQPDLDALQRANTANTADVGRMPCRQRLMTITGDKALAKLLVIPSGTSRELAVMLLRRAADLPVTNAERSTRAFQAADAIVRAGCAENARCELDRHTLTQQTPP